MNAAVHTVDRPTARELGLPPGIRACLFDLDGVLTDTARLHAAAWKTTFDRFLQRRAEALGEPFVPFDPLEDYARYVDGKPRTDGVRSFLAARGAATAAEIVESLATVKNDLVLDLMRRDGVEAYEGSGRYVRAVRAAGLGLAVVSASANCADVLRTAGLMHLVDVRVDGAVAAREGLAGKPAPDTYLAAARAFGLRPAQAAVFEDALAGVAAGRAGGFGYVVGVDRAGRRDALLDAGADVVVEDLGDLLRSS